MLFCKHLKDRHVSELFLQCNVFQNLNSHYFVVIIMK